MKKIISAIAVVFLAVFALLGQSVMKSHKTSAETGKYYELGNDKYFKDDYEGAIEDYTSAIKIDPEYAPAYAFRASALSILGKKRKR
jgi:tetratricopeptide (TPR) repeat protein